MPRKRTPSKPVKKEEAPHITSIFFIGHLGHIARDIWDLFAGCDVTTYDRDDGQDTLDLDKLLEVMPENVDFVFHLANFPHPGPDWKYMYENNVLGTVNVIEAAKKKKAKSIVFFSSLAAIGYDVPLGPHGERICALIDGFADDYHKYDWPKGDPPWDEDTYPLPISKSEDAVIEAYGVSKSWQETELLLSKIPTMILRLGPYCMNPIPPNEKSCYADAASRDMTRVVVKAILKKGIEPGIFHVCRVGMWGGEKLKGWLVK